MRKPSVAYIIGMLFSFIAAHGAAVQHPVSSSYKIADDDLWAEKRDKANPDKNLVSTFDKLSVYLFNCETANFFGCRAEIKVLEKSRQFGAAANLHQSASLRAARSVNLDCAIYHGQRALLCYELQDNKTAVSFMSQNLSYLLQQNGETEKALLYQAHAFYMASSKKRQFELLMLKNQLLIAQGKAQMAINIILGTALPGNYGVNRREKELRCYYALAKSYLAERDFTPAKWFFVQSLSMATLLNNQEMKLKSLLMLSKVKSRQQDYASAWTDLQQALSINAAGPFKARYQPDLTAQVSFVRKKLGLP